MNLGVAGAIVLIVAVAVRLVCALRLLHEYRPHEYLATAAARRLYWTGTGAIPCIGLAIAMLAFASHVWWVEAVGALMFAYTVWKPLWMTHMRRTGKYVEFYRKQQWQ